MVQQLELSESRQECRSYKPVPVSPADPRIDRMLEGLRGKGRWIRREVLFRWMRVEDRTGRKLAEESNGLVASSSQHGYKATLKLTSEEYHHCDAELASRIEKLTARRAALARVWHSGHGEIAALRPLPH